MGKCIVCGKKGLFLKVDANGKCEACAKKDEIEKTIEFEEYYTNLLLCLNNIQEVIEIGNNPIDNLQLIPIFKEKIEKCHELQEEIHNVKYEDRLIKKLIKSITYRDSFSERHGMGTLKEWGISIFVDPISQEFSKDKIFSELDRLMISYKRKWMSAVNSIENCAEFQRIIDDIPSVNVEILDTKYKKQSVSELEELIKYTNITLRTSFDRIGNFVVIDTETTGLSSIKDSLVEVAAIKFEDWTPVSKFHTLINPGKHIPKETSEINNITDDMVVEAPTFSQIIDCFDSFVGKSNIVGHNLPFDLKFLYRNGYDFTTKKRKYYDTCDIAKNIEKAKMKWDREYEEYIINDNYDYDVEDYKLTTLCDYYKIRDNSFAHRALSDALATGLLFKNLAQDKIDL